MKPITLTVAAGGVENLNVTGEFISVKSSNGPLRFKFGSFDVILSQGQKARFPGSFSILEVTNEGAAAVTAEIIAGLGDYEDREVSGTVSLSSGGITTTGDVTVPDSALTIVKAADVTRREIIIQSAPANTGNIRVGDGSIGAAQGLLLSPGGSVTLATSGEVSAYHALGVNQVLHVLEIF